MILGYSKTENVENICHLISLEQKQNRYSKNFLRLIACIVEIYKYLLIQCHIPTQSDDLEDVNLLLSLLCNYITKNGATLKI